ncbi:MAG TPA: zinc ribbon domain-containing protein [Thermoanaerobaculia bacterium]|nr:zinc ribbon domain-containing protein [Thermoanaerobaculia bacterium]
MSQGVCAACNRAIDASAKLCPYCGANPATGDRLDTQAILQEVFRPKETTTSQNVLEYARQRQGVVVTISAILGFLLLAALHAFVTRRNDSDVSGAPAVPLSEVTDIANKPDETTPQTMPNLDFQYDGKPQAMRTFIVEPNAVTPPEVLAAQQAEALAKAAAAAAKNPAATPPGAPPQQRPAVAPQPSRPTPSLR